MRTMMRAYTGDALCYVVMADRFPLFKSPGVPGMAINCCHTPACWPGAGSSQLAFLCMHACKARQDAGIDARKTALFWR